MKRTCVRCKRRRTLERDFYFDRVNNRFLSHCKPCDRASVAARSRKAREDGDPVYEARQRRWNDKRREISRATRNAIKSVPCKDCGRSYPPYVMQFDHLDAKTKVADVSQLRDRSRIVKEAAKCDVVCANCHAERTHRRRVESK